MKPKLFDYATDVPIPPNAVFGKPLKYPWPDMEIGHSLLVYAQPHQDDLQIVRMGVLTSAKGWAVRNSRVWMFTARVDRENNAVRIWRVM